eukprot:TRINITY_DN19122_c0_g2_i1.p1 TRINITY_DN19122_c0_g2~~TRINITY_DN19122_c0_g2_i1.p1  ORF type:complete len:711 (-),score=164.19 TRINITY_DN19122_c0_g2_i1:36-2114(-)
MASAFVQPRYLLAFSESASERLAEKVKVWLQQAGIHIEVDGFAARSFGQPFLVVSAERDKLEPQAEHFGYIKAHRALAPHVEGQGFGKIEFEIERAAEDWVKGYDGYDTAQFWSPCEKSQLLLRLLEQVPVDKVQLEELQVGIAALSVSGSLVPALRIAGLLETMVPLDEDLALERNKIWKAGSCSCLSPADEIQAYFGSYVAMYFAWMNSFTRWLIAPAVFGLACWLHMRVSGHTVDDDPYLPFHSLFVVFWSMAFLCGWDFECAAKAWRWNVFGEEREEEVRPEFQGELRKSRATGRLERYSPYGRRLAAYATSAIVTACMLFVAFCVMVCSLNLQGYMEQSATTFERAFYVEPLAQLAEPGALFDPDQTEYFGLLTFGPTVLHVIAIMQLNKLYSSVAEWLTDNENHRLVEHHEQSLILKRFFFEAFDCYISLFYVGFVQQDMRKLRQELVGLYTVDSLRRVVTETALPLVTQQMSRWQLARRAADLKRHDRAHYMEALEVLQQAEYDQFDDFLEMVIEFGYVTLFAAAFPLASAVSIASNLIELKSDLFKLTKVYRRPVSVRASNIGIWRRLLQVMVAASVLTYMMIFSMSEQLAAWAPGLYREASAVDVQSGRLASFVDETTGTADLVMKQGSGRWIVMTAFCIEHVVALLGCLFELFIPRQPEWVSDEVRRTACFKRTKAKQHAAK